MALAGKEVKLYYFDIRGRAEVCRMMMNAAGQKFEDVRWSFEDWPKWKKESPYGTAPFIDIDGKRYGESMAIQNFLARELGFYGKSSRDALRVDEVVQLYADLQASLVKAHYLKDPQEKAELMKKCKEELLPKTFEMFEKLLRENGTGYFVGDQLSLADLVLYEGMVQTKQQKVFENDDKFKDLQKLKEKVESNKKLMDYIKNRKQTHM